MDKDSGNSMQHEGEETEGSESHKTLNEATSCMRLEDEEDAKDEPYPIWRGMGAYEEGEMDVVPPAGVVVVDPFCDYLGKAAVNMVEEAGYAAVQTVSEHLIDTIDDSGLNIFRVPSPGREAEWAAELPFPIVAVLCESDAGLATAERLSSALLGSRFGGVEEARRNKFLMNEAVRSKGLTAARQATTGDWGEAQAFIQSILNTSSSSSDSGGNRGGQTQPGTCADVRGAIPVVVKPLRGCGSGGVCLCHGMEEAKKAFLEVLGAPKYGSPGEFNTEVLVQEFLQGTEFVVDTVSREGEHKIMAIWRYDKRPVNGAPFVYFATQLRAASGGEEQRVIEYARKALDALGVKYGPTHTGVSWVGGGGSLYMLWLPLLGPVLVEVNTRWHLTEFAPITLACVGYEAVSETLSAYLDPERFSSIPSEPLVLNKHGRVVHLVCHSAGTLKAVHHLEEIQKLESFAGLDVYPKFSAAGSAVDFTIDIRSDAGWVHLVHEDEGVVDMDYQKLVGLMPTMFEVVDLEGHEEDTGGG
ncbi:unnamed protein product [Discosporangium mesarthrocarpum]